MNSIRTKLLTALMGGIFFVVMIASLALYWNVKTEISELYDNQAEQLLHQQGQTVDSTQTAQEREELIIETSLMAIIPLFLILPILLVFIGLIVRRELSPLHVFQEKVVLLDEHSLEPLVFSSLPLELKPLADALNAMIERLKIATQARKNFVADAAHELRTPLAALLFQLDFANKSTDPKDQKLALNTLEKGIHRANRLIEQLLMLARQEGNETSALVEINLTQLLSDLLVSLMPLAEAKEIELEVKQIEQVTITAQEYDIQTVVANLLDNAIRYTPQRGNVSLSLYTQKNSVILTITDNGVGIKESEKERVFDRFYRVHNHNSIGSGLGLSIVKEICQKYDIKITLEDNIPTGTVFTLEFHKEKSA
ncbi:ATP-binding protein [Sulfuricurvum sp.]|uniref:sensor histidine kinase n=1 Tax=Sulfuricurvum sp. TaxID=2025608 RepID=UPI0026333E04|nr:ATP-binding protein [Sulfuricurvum sp.]MDD3596314.1 ATP-binding protein [Sulfuricurvum sp.]